MGLVCPDVEIGIQDRLRTDCESVWVRLPLRAHTYHFKKFSSRRRYGKPLATVNGSNSAGKTTIEIPPGESAPIGCSATDYVLLTPLIGSAPLEDLLPGL